MRLKFIICVWLVFLNMVIYAYDFIGQREFHLISFAIIFLSMTILISATYKDK